MKDLFLTKGQCLKYLLSLGRNDLVPWTPRVFEICARKWMSLGFEDLFFCCQNGHLECLKYAHENGCPWDEKTCSKCCQKWSPRVFEIRARKRMSLERIRLVLIAAQNGHLECLKYAHESGCPWDADLFFCCLKWSPRVFEIRARKRMSLGCKEMDLFLLLPKRSPRVFEIRARKRMSLGTEWTCYLLLPKWSPRVFEIRARKRMSLE